MIPKAFTEAVVRKTDIVAVISGYVDLSERGSSLIGLCPFDAGDKPTLTVSPDKQIWKCFKCGKGGNVIGFVMEADQLSFPEAIRFLAKRLDLEVPDSEV